MMIFTIFAPLFSLVFPFFPSTKEMEKTTRPCKRFDPECKGVRRGEMQRGRLNDMGFI